MADRDVRTKFTVDANDAINALNRLSKRAKDVNLEFDALGNATVSFSSTMRVARNQLDAQADLMRKNAQSNKAFAESLARIVSQNRKVASSTKNVTKAQKEQESVLRKLGSAFDRGAVKTRSFTDMINKLRVGMYALRQVMQGVIDGTQAAINYVENFNLAAVAFGKDTKEMMKFVQNFSSAFRLDEAQVTRYAGLFYQVSQSLGLTSEQAKALAKNWTKLNYDLSSFYNIGFEEANTKLMAGLVGETEPLRRIGIILTENNLAITANNLGIEKSIRNMTEAEKIQLRYLTALDQTTNAQGDFARTFDQTANQIRIFEEQFSVLMREIGHMLIPVVERWAAIFSVVASALAEIIHQYNAENGLLPALETVNAETSGYKTTMDEAAQSTQRVVSVTADWSKAIQEAIKLTSNLLNNLSKVLSSVKNINNTATLGIDELNILSPTTAGTGNYDGWSTSGLTDSLDKTIEQFEKDLENAKKELEDALNGQINLELPDYENVIGDNLSIYQEKVSELVKQIVDFANEISIAIAPAVEAINIFREALRGGEGETDFFTLAKNVATVMAQVVAGIFDAFTAIYEIVSGVIQAVGGSALPEMMGIQRNEDGSVAITNDNIRTITKYITELMFGMKALSALADIVSPIKNIASDVFSIAGWKLSTAILSVAVISFLAKKGIDYILDKSEESSIVTYAETGVLTNPGVSFFGAEGQYSENFASAIEDINVIRQSLVALGKRSTELTIGSGEDAQTVEVFNPQYLQDVQDAWKFYQNHIYWPASYTGRAQRESIGWQQTDDFDTFKSEIYDASWFQELFRSGYSDSSHRQRMAYWSDDHTPATSPQQQSIDDWNSKILRGVSTITQLLDEPVVGAYIPPSDIDKQPPAQEEPQTTVEATEVVVEQPASETQPIEIPEQTPVEAGDITIESPTDEAQPIDIPDVEIEQPEIEITNDQPVVIENNTAPDTSPVVIAETPATTPENVPSALPTLPLNFDFGGGEETPIDLTPTFSPNDFGEELNPVIASYETVADETLTPIEAIEATVSTILDTLDKATSSDNTDLGEEGKEEQTVTVVTEEGGSGDKLIGARITTGIVSAVAGVASSLVNGFSSMLDSYINSGLIYQDENGKYQSNIGNVSENDKYTQNQVASDMLHSFAGFLPDDYASWYTAGINLAEALSNGLITSFVEDMPTIMNWVVNFVKETTDEIVKVMPQLLESLASPDIWTGLLEAIFQTIISSIEILPQILTMASTIIQKLVEGLIEYLPKIVEAFADGKFWSDMLNTLVDLALFLVENIDQIIDAILTGIPALVNAIIDAIFSVNWLAVGWNIVVKITEGIINGAISLVETVINTITGTISKLWTWLGIPAIPQIHIPRVDFSGALMSYATGGFPEEGQLFIAREAGAEMVGSLGGRTAVANNDQIVEGIRAGVYDAVVEAMGQTGGKQGVTVYLDGKKIYQNQRRVAKRTGLGFGMEGV